MSTLGSGDLLRCVGKVLLTIGGSSITEHRNPTSDVDLFAIGSTQLLSVVKRLISSLKRTDLEVRDPDWLEAISTDLLCFHPPINGSALKFSFWDLRFLARVSLGQPLIPHQGFSSVIDSITEPLRKALATFFSTLYINIYEDIVGLLLGGRYEDAVLIAGELAQRACMLSLYQLKLVDPAPKASFAILRGIGSPRFRKQADKVLQHLQHYSGSTPRDWVVNLLNATNRLVAAGISATLPDPDGTSGEGDLQDPHIAEQLAEPVCCLMGIPGFLTMVNTKTSSIQLCNQAFVKALANSV